MNSFAKKNIQDFLKRTGLSDEEDSFYIVDMKDIVAKIEKWFSHLPQIKPFYAVKCNNDPRILRLMVDAGMSFDCASVSEIKSVTSLGVDNSRIIFANPSKQVTAIRYAKSNEIPLMTFDNLSELLKIKKEFPEAKLLLRILPPTNGKVQCNLGLKFGCFPEDVVKLLSSVVSLKLNLVGISFHVGSGCEDEELYWHAISSARDAFSVAHRFGLNPYLLDIGGGFPGSSDSQVSFKLISNFINSGLETFFPKDDFPNLEIIAEPGRFFVASAYTLFTRVVNRRETSNKMMYYLNDGVYGAFNCVMYDHALVKPTFPGFENDIKLISDLWGPTCDSIDCVMENVEVPRLKVGDFIVFHNMGAYTLVAASKFNGMNPAKCFYLEDILPSVPRCR